MVKAGYKTCHACNSEIPIRCSKCTECNIDQRKRNLSAAVSPVGISRLTAFRSVALSSPARPRRIRSQVTAPAARATEPAQDEEVLPDAQHSCSSDDDPWPGVIPATPVSPVAQAMPAHSDSLQSYVHQLKLVQNRCMLVGESDRGAACYAVAGHAPGARGNVSIMVCMSSSTLTVIYCVHSSSI